MDKQGLLSLKKNKNGSYIILIQYCKDGTFLKSTGVSLPKLNTTQVEFFKRKQKLPSNVPNYEIFNDHIVGELGKFDNLINRFFSAFKKYPTKSELESYLKFSSGTLQDQSQDFIHCLSIFIERKSQSKDTKQYKTLDHHLRMFMRYKNMGEKKIYFTSLSVEFFKEFFTFLSMPLEFRFNGKIERKLALCDNGLKKLSYSIASSIRQIKKYQISDYDRDGIIDNIHVASEELNISTYVNKEIVLSHHEIEILTNFRLSDGHITNKKGEVVKTINSKSLERVKNLFLLQTIKGTRHSDLHKLNVNNVFDGQVFVRQQKTKHQYNIKIDDTTIDLMKRSDSGRSISNQKYNEYLKLVFKQFFPYYKKTFKSDDIGYKLEGFPVIKYYLGVEKKEFKCRYELVKTHTARRSYVSVAKIKHGLTDMEIQHDIGQTDPKSIEPYEIYYEEGERSSVFNIKIEEKNTPVESKSNQLLNDQQ